VPPVHSARPLWDLAHPAPAAPAPGLAPRLESVPRRADTGFTSRVSTPLLGVLAFIFSEATFFGALIVAYIEFHAKTGGGPSASILDVPRTALFSIALFASSATLAQAERRLTRDDQRGFNLWLLATIALGAIFLYGQGTEYLHLFADGLAINTNLFTASFFTLTGFHGLHVTVGVVMLATLAYLGLRGDFRGHRHHGAVSAISAYWHFVDGVWVIIFSLVYLVLR
jgi:heme/copper-type cytochrome/quinol oxidase subunit 3